MTILTRSLIPSLLAVALFHAGPVASAEGSDVIVGHGDTQVTVFDVRQAVDAQVPKDKQFQLYGAEKKLRDFVGSMFVKAKLAERGAKRDLTPEQQWMVDESLRRIYSQIEIEHVLQERGEPEGLEEFAREVYLASPERFTEPPAIHAQHVLISTQERSDEEALELAHKVRQDALDGVPFEELAVEYSEDRSVQNNQGDLGFFPKGRMVKPFEEAAFALESAGDITEPVKTRFGYHVIRLVEKRGERVRPFDEVKATLIAEEKAKHRDKVVNELIESIGSLDGVQTNNEALESLIQRMPSKPHSHSGEKK